MIKIKSIVIIGLLLGIAGLSFFIASKGERLLCAKVIMGTMKDSVTGNIQVLAEQTFQLKSHAQGVVTFVAIKPLSKAIQVTKGQILVQLDISDLNRSLKKALMEKRHFEQRIDGGSTFANTLEIEIEELNASTALFNAEKITLAELNRKKNIVTRLRIEVEQEKISDSEKLISHSIRIEDLKAQINKMTIRSPINGELISSNVSSGELISLGHNLGTIISNERLIEASLDEEDFVGIKEGLVAVVSLFSTGNQIIEAKVSRLSPTVNASTGRRLLYLESLQSTQMAQPGMSGRVEIIKSKKEDRLLLPSKSLIGNSVFLVREGKAFIRSVKIGARNLKSVEILEGLKVGDIVVYETPHILNDGQKIKPILTNHIH
jgi:RND family efflux transporter MFP subunit